MSNASASRWRAVALLDRDGTVMHDVPYLSDPEGIELLPRAAGAIALLRSEGVCCVLTTNQSGIARGLVTEEQLAAIHKRLTAILEAEGAELDAIYHAPGHPSAAEERFRRNLEDRKPAPGMARRAVEDLHLEGIPIFAVGDKISDVEFGRNAGGTGLLVLTGLGAGERSAAEDLTPPAPVVEDLWDSAHWILNDLILRESGDEVLAAKLRTPGQLAGEVLRRKAAGLRTVFTNGCFDLVHGGHVSYLEDARSKGDALILGVNSNASISRLKGAGRPILDEAARLTMLAALEAVDFLTVFHTDSADWVLEAIRPDCHAKGTDYRSDSVPERETARRLGIEVAIAGAPKENSTRDIIDVIVERTRTGLLARET